jgi:TonB family protein
VSQISSAGELFREPPRSRRSWPAVVVSSVLHVTVLVPILYFARETVATVVPRASHVLAFISPVPAPDPAFVVPLAPVRKPTPRPEPIARLIEPPKMPVAPIPVARVEPKPVVAEPRRELPVKVEPPRPATPPVTVGAFATSVPSARTTDPVRTVHSAGFDAPAARAPEMKLEPSAPVAKTGAFEASPSSANARPGSDRAAVVANAGFGTVNSGAPAAPKTRAIGDAGFGVASAGAAPTAAPQAVRSSGFDASTAPVAAAAQTVRPARIDVPVEILGKPTPAYTDEARALKLEGEVVLEVEFCARGTIKVLRVVKGLGHGLDESASRAAEAIRFKPAQSSGRPVNFKSTVHIVFRLA